MPTGPPQQKMLSAELAADIAGDAAVVRGGNRDVFLFVFNQVDEGRQGS